jgi:UDP-N-acetylmuramoyl-tripeptide--D-alanyl-D-alanine ligase
LENLANLLDGKIVSSRLNHKIPFDVGKFRSTKPMSITFITKSFANEQALLTLLESNAVHCVVIKSSNILTLSKWKAADIAIIEVQNLNKAYRSLATFYREQFFIPFIQVIGSSGKTTTKEMIGAVLNEKFPTLISLKNMNSPTGVANNLFRLNHTFKAAVLEAGMKSLGIIRTATRLIKPDIGVITSIHSAHLTRLGSIQNIIAAKAEIFEYLSKDGCIIVNWDDPNCHRLPIHRYQGKLIRYGFSKQCDLWASEIQRQGLRTNFIVNTKDLQFACTINIVGRYNIGNALAAVAVGLKMGLSPVEIANGLAHFNPVSGRLKVYHRSDGVVIIDDTYNANPDSTRLLVDELIIMARKQPVVLVIGDMERPSLDIENYARRVHFNIGQQLAQGEFQHVMAIGLWAREYVRGAVQSGFPHHKISYYETVGAAEASFKFLLMPGTTVVLKASTYTKLKNLPINASYNS